MCEFASGRTNHLDRGGPLPKLGFNLSRALDCCGTTEGTESPINSYSSLEIPCGLLLAAVGFLECCCDDPGMGSGTERTLRMSAAEAMMVVVIYNKAATE